MTWFERLVGFPEESPEQVRQQLTVSGDKLISKANGRVLQYGRLEIPSLAELRHRISSEKTASGKLNVRVVIADVEGLHQEAANGGALFQVASQFNLLEMASPEITPEEGVGIYEQDQTQGPACAIAAGAGTIYRNYFVPVNGQIGQTHDNQIDCLSDLGTALGNTDNQLWQMRNGYALAYKEGLCSISERLISAEDNDLDELRGLLRIGIQWNTEVTLDGAEFEVTQAYCAALPIISHPAAECQDFARLILDASYEATICAAILNGIITGNNRVYLTLVGGGVFGNKLEWIAHSIKRVLRLYQSSHLDVRIVSYSKSKPVVQQLIDEFNMPYQS